MEMLTVFIRPGLFFQRLGFGTGPFLDLQPAFAGSPLGGEPLGGKTGLGNRGRYGGAASALGLFGARMLLALGIGVVLYLFRAVGAGDVKLAALIIGILGLQRGGAGLGIGFVLAAAWAACRMAGRGMFRERLAFLLGYGRHFLRDPRPRAYYEQARDGRGAVIPLGLCMVLGVGIESWLGR